jgi:L-malate glycosyltransferase
VKKIIHLRSTFSAGGTENLLVRIFNANNSLFKMILVLFKPGIMMKYLHSDTNVSMLFKRKRKIDLLFFIRLCKLIIKERPYALHTHQEIELVYATICKVVFPRLRIFHQIHLHNPIENKWFAIERFFCRYFVCTTIVVSKSLKKYLVENGYPENKIVVLYNIIEKTNELSINNKNEFLRNINASENDKIVGMIGNFVKEKDQLTLAKAFNNVRNNYPDLKLVFIGEESSLSEPVKSIFSEKDLNERVFFMGQIANASELIPFFSLLVLSSHNETFGIAAIEALLCKVPVLTSNIPVMKELSHDGKYFELFEVGNPIELSLKIKKIIIEGVDKERISDARKYAESSFNSQKYIEKLAKIYQV